MKLDLNFSAVTKLREWWKQVQNNFRIIETECTETRKIADNACTKEQAQTYVAEFAGASDEYMEAIREFTALYKESGGTVSALESLYGKRLAYYEYDEGLDADDTDKTINAVYVCNSGAVNTPTDSGVLFNFTHNAGNGVQIWFDGSGAGIYKRSENTWSVSYKEVSDRLDTAENAISGKCEVVCGTYTGNGETERFINLGFTPTAVKVCEARGYYDNNSGQHIYNGMALQGHPCSYLSYGNLIEVTDGGFKASHRDYNFTVNSADNAYYFIAYKNGTIMEVV